MLCAPRVLSAGCGGIGSVVGCLLRQAGHKGAMLGRDWHLRAIRSHGLRVDGIWREHYADNFHFAASAKNITGGFDSIVSAVKAYDTESIVCEHQQLLKDDGLAPPDLAPWRATEECQRLSMKP